MRAMELVRRDVGRVKVTRLGLMPPLAAAVLGALSVLTADSWLLLLSGGALGLLVAAFVLPPRIADLDVVVDHPHRSTVGDVIGGTIRVTNTGDRRSSLARVTHERIGLAPVTVLVPSLPPGGSADVRIDRQVLSRGSAPDGASTIVSSEPLGLLERTATRKAVTELVSHPRLVPVSLGPLLAAEDGQGTPVVARSGLDVHGVREWQPGDGTRQVHWRSTARRGRLVVLERETRIGVGFALLVAGPSDQPSWEPLVALTASTAVAAARAGRRVGLFAAQPGLDEITTGDRVGLLDWCAALDEPALPPPALVGVALRRVGSGGQLVVAATWLPPAWWASTAAAARAAGVRLEVLTSEPTR